MKDIHDFAAAAVSGVMLETVALKRQMSAETIAQRSYQIGEAMMKEAEKRGWGAPAGSEPIPEDILAQMDREFEKTKDNFSKAKMRFDFDGEPIPEDEFSEEDNLEMEEVDPDLAWLEAEVAEVEAQRAKVQQKSKKNKTH